MRRVVIEIEIDRARYAQLYGPTTGDRIRLADTNLLIEVTDDACVGGDEAVFGGGKVIRESMGQSTATRAEGAPDLVITGVVILDHGGVVKDDVGIRDGRIVVSAGGEPDITEPSTRLVIGPSTEILAGNGKILTAGAVELHVHLSCPQLLDTALASGVTTIIGGGTGPADGTKATTVTAGREHPDDAARPRRLDDSTSLSSARATRCRRRAARATGGRRFGLKLHEDWGHHAGSIEHACGSATNRRAGAIHTTP